jgi:hypothetical protein
MLSQTAIKVPAEHSNFYADYCGRVSSIFNSMKGIVISSSTIHFHKKILCFSLKKTGSLNRYEEPQAIPFNRIIN